jgi:hypothetical protein
MAAFIEVQCGDLAVSSDGETEDASPIMIGICSDLFGRGPLRNRLYDLFDIRGKVYTPSISENFNSEKVTVTVVGRIDCARRNWVQEWNWCTLGCCFANYMA